MEKWEEGFSIDCDLKRGESPKGIRSTGLYGYSRVISDLGLQLFVLNDMFRVVVFLDSEVDKRVTFPWVERSVLAFTKEGTQFLEEERVKHQEKSRYFHGGIPSY